MNARATVLLATVGLVAEIGCSGRTPPVVRDGAVEGITNRDVTGNGGVSIGTGGVLGSGGVSIGTGGVVGSGGVSVGTGGVVGSGGVSTGKGGAVGGGRVGSGGWVGSGGTTGGLGGAGGGGAGGTTDCLGTSPLGAGVGGGACEGVRCIDAKSATLGYETCSWLVTAGRASVFEALRACFRENPDFCSLQPASVEACTSLVSAQACAGPGATVDGVKVDCHTLAAECTAVSEHECHLMTDILNDRYYQAAFECYFRQSPAPSDCRAALRKCTGAPTSGTGTGGAGGNDGGVQPPCPDLAGPWNVVASCYGPGAFVNGPFIAVMTQAGCKLTFTQTDDQTAKEWVATGPIDSTGIGSLTGKFGFTDSTMCDLKTTSDGWAGRCGSATQACELQATRPIR